MAAAQQSGGQPDNSAAIIWITAAIFVALGVIWWSFKKQLITFYFYIKVWEIDLLSLFTHRLDDVRTIILTTDPNSFDFNDVTKVGDLVGSYLRYPFVAVLVGLAVLIYFTNSTRVFKRIYNMRALVQLEKDNWPQITPVAHLDLIKSSIDKGPWAMALTPMQFCKRYHLLEEYRKAPQEGMMRKEWNKVEVALKRGQANKIFAIQLGPLWPGLNRVPPHIRALFGAFAARINNDTKTAFDLYNHINRSTSTKLDFTGANELCRKHENTKLVQKVLNNHAYLLTVMASMLEMSRLDGVQAVADFLWLKPVDRRLWYMLNTVGRQTPFCEVAGPFAHWVAEKEIGRKLVVPMIEEATNALELALKEIIYKPEETT